MKVALWGKFPSKFSEGKIAPKLAIHGFDVIKFLDTRTSSSTDLSKVEVVLCLAEYAAHEDTQHIETIAKTQGVPIVCLSRKESFWDRDLKHLKRKIKENEMPPPHSIVDEKVTDFCTAYMELAKKGTTHDRMVQSLNKFWSNGKLTNDKQLSQYVRGLIKTGRAPKWFIEFNEQFRTTFRNERREQKIAHEQAIEELALENKPSKEIESKEIESKETALANLDSDKSEYDQLDDMYKDEIVTLNERIKNLEMQLQVLNTGTNSPLKVGRVLDHLMESVDLGLSSKEDAMNSLIQYIKKNNV